MRGLKGYIRVRIEAAAHRVAALAGARGSGEGEWAPAVGHCDGVAFDFKMAVFRRRDWHPAAVGEARREREARARRGSVSGGRWPGLVPGLVVLSTGAEYTGRSRSHLATSWVGSRLLAAQASLLG